MAKIETYSCDICQTQKKETNEWWKGFVINKDKSTGLAGCLVLKWNSDVVTDPVVNSDRQTLIPDQADAHLCGSNCVTQWLSKQVLEQQ